VAHWFQKHLNQTTPQQIVLRFLQGNRTLVLLRAAAAIAVIALVDWRFDVNISFGFLYLFPMLMVGSCLTPWQIAGVAALCTGLVEAFDPFPWATAIGSSRIFLTFAAFTGAGLYVFESARNRRLASQHLSDVEHEMDLRREAETQLKVLIESSPACIFTLDAEGRVLLANDAAHRLLPAIGQEEGGATMLEIGIVFGLEMKAALQQQRRHPMRVIAINLERQAMEVVPLRFGLYRDDFDDVAHNSSLAKSAAP